ncbi:NAD(P)H-dependent oxidoreductase [Oceanicaulis sp. MMSF_3324]|uniref:NAD(P)H-dependent oxidoreductase n=1 Tax=Oceanicaulis sp. MMSF_3324 TaxID=3046702 RepID=UPI00273E7DB9|nr:NAD(P)H-dependent oxidoreductase [Oceanicaulis sp. MMSF_3324]
MSRILVYFAHPGRRYSRANLGMADTVSHLAGVTYIDLYEHYPRHDIDIETEQDRLLEHDVIVFQFPLFWYSTPSLLKDWIDLVLEHGFAYGEGGEQLRDKALLCAITCSSSEEAYSSEGFQHYPLRTFLTPLEQTARLCQMRFLPPYVLYDSLKASEDERLGHHELGYKRLMIGLREGDFDYERAREIDILKADGLDAVLPAAEASHG